MKNHITKTFIPCVRIYITSCMGKCMFSCVSFWDFCFEERKCMRLKFFTIFPGKFYRLFLSIFFFGSREKQKQHRNTGKYRKYYPERRNTYKSDPWYLEKKWRKSIHNYDPKVLLTPTISEKKLYVARSMREAISVLVRIDFAFLVRSSSPADVI